LLAEQRRHPIAQRVHSGVVAVLLVANSAATMAAFISGDGRVWVSE
jgi:hypothetical protein